MPFPPCPRVPLPLVFNFLRPVTLIFRVSPVLQEKEIYTIDEEHALNKSSQNRNQTVFIILLDLGGWLTPFIDERESNVLSQAKLPGHSFLQPGSWLMFTEGQCLQRRKI